MSKRPSRSVQFKYAARVHTGDGYVSIPDPIGGDVYEDLVGTRPVLPEEISRMRTLTVRLGQVALALEGAIPARDMSLLVRAMRDLLRVIATLPRRIHRDTDLETSLRRLWYRTHSERHWRDPKVRKALIEDRVGFLLAAYGFELTIYKKGVLQRTLEAVFSDAELDQLFPSKREKPDASGPPAKPDVSRILKRLSNTWTPAAVEREIAELRGHNKVGRVKITKLPPFPLDA